ncbi:MAG: L,D-transpeptidase family protein [Vitreoscilla sp.]|nr:L,D-transpeptidase family protein [Vitreoscilla sp.]
MTLEYSNPKRRRGAVMVGTLGLLCAGMLSAADTRGLTLWWSGGLAAAATGLGPPASLRMRLADDRPQPRPANAGEALTGSPESRLIAIYRLVARHELDDALVASTALVQSHPNFRLAQLLHADLLAARAAPLAAWGGAVPEAELTPMRDEALQRLAALRERPAAGMVPAEFVQLPPSVPFAIAVDAARSRLYLFENSAGGLKLVDDFYISVGKQGVEKLVEGDQRTPLGLYFTTGRIDPRALEDRFGVGALPLNYPNAYDRNRGRTGSGILLHGVPAATYSRPPQDSDGCVVLANEDLLSLAGRLPLRDTPVLISRQIDWRAPAGAQAAAHPAFLKSFQRWQQARLASDADTLASFYPSEGPSDGAAIARFRQRAALPPSAISDTSLITWRDDRELMIATFREQAGAGQRRDRVMRQYWGRDGSAWVIVAEGQVH